MNLIQLVGGTSVSGVEQVLICKKNDRKWGMGKKLEDFWVLRDFGPSEEV